MTSPGVAGPRVGLFGLLGSGNVGNDASLEAVLAYLRADHPDAVIDAMCMGTVVGGLPTAVGSADLVVSTWSYV